VTLEGSVVQVQVGVAGVLVPSVGFQSQDQCALSESRTFL